MTAEPHDTPPRRARLPWWIAGAAVVVAAVVVALVLTPGHAADSGDRDSGDRDSGDRDSGDRDSAAEGTGPTGTTTGAREPGYDLSTPEAAAASFAAAARTGSGDALLDLACLGRPSCSREHGVGEAQLAEAQATIRDNVHELADHLEGAEFTSAVDGDEPGTKDVPYRTPAMTGDAYLTLTFVESGGDWLYYGPTA